MIRFLLSILSVLAFAPVQAQAPADLLPWRINRHVYYARYTEAQAEVDKALQDRAAQPESKEYATALSLSGFMDWTYARYGKADTSMTMAAAIFERNGMTADSNYLKTLYWQAGICRDLNQYERAKIVLEKGLAAGEQCRNTPHAAYKAWILQQYAWLDVELCHFGDAKLHYKQLRDFNEKHYGKKHPEYAKSLTQYANFLQGNISEYKEAGQALLDARKILEPLREQYPQEYSSMLESLSDLYGNGAPNYRLSLQLIEEATSFTRQQLGEQHPRYAACLRRLATGYYYNTPYFFKGDTLRRQALAIYTKHFGELYPNRIGLMQDIASWYGTLGRNGDATKQRKEAYDLCLRMFGSAHTNTAMLTLAVANDLQNEGKRLEADTLIDKALAIYKERFGTLHSSYIGALSSKVHLWQWQGRNEKADSLLTNIQNKKGELYGRNSPEWFSGIYKLITHDLFNGKRLKCDSLIRLSETYYKEMGWENTTEYWNLLSSKSYYFKWEQRYPEALTAANDYIMLVEKNLGKENFWYLSAIRQVVEIKTKLKDFQAVENAIAEYGRISDKIYGPISESRQNYLHDLAQFYLASRSESDVLKIREEAVDLEEQLGGSGQLYCSNLCMLASSYSDFGKYEDARKLLEKAQTVAKSTFGTEDESYAFLLWTISNTYSNLEDYDKAASVLGEMKEVLLRLNAFKDDYKEVYLFSMGKIEDERGNYNESEKYFQEWGKMERGSLDYGYYNLYGTLLTSMERFAEADSMLQIGLSILEKAQEDKGFMYSNIALNLNQLGNYRASLDTMEKSMQTEERRLGRDNPKFAVSLGNYASSLSALDRLTEADSFYVAALNLIKNTKGQDNDDYAMRLNNYGVYLCQKGLLQEAEDIFSQALKINEKIRRTDHPDYYVFLSNLQWCYQEMGKLKESEKLSLQVLDYWRERARLSASYGGALSGYGTFCKSIGQNDRAIAAFTEMKDIYARIYGPKSPRVVEALSRIGTTQIAAKQYDAAIATFQQCLAMDSSNVGTKHSLYAFDLHHLGNCYFLKGNYKEAETYLQKSRKMKESLFAMPVKHFGETYSILASVYEAQNRLSDAEQACRRAVEVLQASAGEKSEEYLQALQRLGSILAAQGRETESKMALHTADAGYRSKVRGAFSYFSTVQQQSLIAKYNLLEFYPAFQGDKPPAFWGGMAYDNALLLKGVALQNSRTLREKLATDTALARPYSAWLDALNNVYAQYRLPIPERTALDSLEKVAEAIEKRLAEHSPDYKTYLAGFDIHWQDVQKRLKDGEAAIEFVRYNRKKPGGEDDFWYAGVVLLPTSKGKEPVFVPLCAEKDLPGILQDNKLRKPDVVAAIYKIEDGSTRGSEGDVRQAPAPSLYDKIWKPLDKLLREANAGQIYFSPVGLLHRVNFGALGFNESGADIRLWDAYTLQQIGSTRELVLPTTLSGINNGRILHIGNIDYGSNPDIAKDSTRSNPFKILKNAAENMRQTDLIITRNHIELDVLVQNDATENRIMDRLKSDRSPKAILFDTHGFFLPEPVNAKSDTVLAHLYWERNPMMQSGLAFAGANDSLARGRNADAKTDGVLTAMDFAGTNLKGTEVVLLPICNSALGKIENVEGVFGLQRALKQAGVHFIIMSLWEVPDPGIQKFTDTFLEHWLGGTGMSIPDAFRETQKNCPKGYDLRVWGAMILIE